MRRIQKLLCLLFTLCFLLTVTLPVSGEEESLPSSDSGESSSSAAVSSASTEESYSAGSSPLSATPSPSSNSISSPESVAASSGSTPSTSRYTHSSASTAPFFAPTDPVPPFYWSDAMDAALNNGCTYLKLNEKSSEYLLATGISGISSDIATATRILDEIEQKQGQYDSALALSRDILTLTFSSFNPVDFRDVNLIQELANTSLLEGQDLYQQSIALIAFDSGNFSVPKDAPNNRRTLISRILNCQQEDGGFSGTQDDSASTVIATAVAVTALSSYQQEPEITDALQKALSYLQTAPFPKDCSSLAWMITALSSLSLLPTDARFTEGTTDLVTELLSYQQPDGGFSQTKEDTTTNPTITEEAMIALTAAKQQTNPFIVRNSISYDSQDSTHSLFSIVGIAVGSILILAAAGCIVWVFIRRKKQHHSETE